MNHEALENALRAWVVTASGYGEESVIWAEQNGPRPDGDIITLQLGAILAEGACDAYEETVDLDRPDGEEVEVAVEGTRSFQFTIQCFTEATYGNTCGRAILTNVQTRARLPSIKQALLDAGVTLFDLGTVQYLPAIAGTAFEGRAVLEVGVYATSRAVEYTGYINEVVLEGEVSSVSDTLTVTGEV